MDPWCRLVAQMGWRVIQICHAAYKAILTSASIRLYKVTNASRGFSSISKTNYFLVSL